jgi:carboxyl-terminal processing protease
MEDQSLKKSRSWLLMRILLVALQFLAIFAAGYFIRAVADSRQDRLELVSEAVQVIRTYALTPPEEELPFERAMIHAAVGTLGDPFSVYVEPAQHELQSDDLAGEYGGIGALLTIDDAGRVILTPFETGPAYEAGIRDGDILFSVDRRVIGPFPGIGDLIADLRGVEGSRINLGVVKADTDGPPISYELTRMRFEIPSVTTYLSPLNPATGIIKIIRFAENTPEEVEAGYNELIEAGISGLILDLRDNGGGLLESTVDLGRYFLKSGIVLTEERAAGEDESFRVEQPGPAADIPLLIIINGNTASAAEVLAAALRENGRALLIGSQTFGKGTVQAVVELSDGSSLHITTARWLTPGGETLDGVGLSPDFRVESSDDNGPDPFLALAEQLFLKGAGDQ